MTHLTRQHCVRYSSGMLLYILYGQMMEFPECINVLYIYIHTHIYKYICIYMYIYIYNTYILM